MPIRPMSLPVSSHRQGGGGRRSLPPAVYEIAAALLASLAGWQVGGSWENAVGWGLAALLGSGAGRWGSRGWR